MEGKTKTILTVEDYLALQEPKTRSLLEELRLIIRKAAPQAEEVISYQMPAFKFHGMLAHYAGYKNHYGLYISPAILKVFKDQLSDYKLAKATIQFPLNQTPPKKLIKEIIQYAVQENIHKAQLKEEAKKLKKKSK